MKRILVQTQLSNIVNHNFDLACDSGWQMVINRCREMLKLNSDLCIDIMGPLISQLIDYPENVNPDLWEKYGELDEAKLRYIGHRIIPNALITRYDFDWLSISDVLDLRNIKYDAVYINDPLHLRNFKAMFHIAGYQPKFYVHAHFVDVPECPKFPTDASLWLGQCESALKADYNFWQCESAMNQFFDSMGKWFVQDVVDDVRAKSVASDDGYSIDEITQPIKESNLRFSFEDWNEKTQGKVVLFFPNRISPSSGDYTNGMKFMFEILPELRKRRHDFVVVCGNPNMKFSNDELLNRCGDNGYIKLHDFTLNRDEYKFVARHSDIAIGLYNADTYGGTSARECVELGCCPLWIDNFEYSSLAREAGIEHLLAKSDFTDIVDVADKLIGLCSNYYTRICSVKELENISKIRDVVRSRCSYEKTVPEMMRRMKLL